MTRQKRGTEVAEDDRTGQGGDISQTTEPRKKAQSAGGPVETQARTENISPEDYQTQGRTSVAVPRPYRFAPTDKGLPVIDHEGIRVTADEADALVEESEGLVYKVDEEGDQS